MIYGETESRGTHTARAAGIAVVLVAMMTACSEEITGPGVMLPITTIYPSRLQGRPVAGNEAVQSQHQWQLVWNDIHHDFSSVPPLPSIDFSYQTVLVASRGEQNNSCYPIEITEVRRVGGKLDVTVALIDVVWCGCLPAVAHPTHAVVIDSTLPVFFHPIRTTYSCPHSENDGPGS